MLNGKQVLIRNVLHVSGSGRLLYSLWAHLNQLRCGFIGLCATVTSDKLMAVYFQIFAIHGGGFIQGLLPHVQTFG